MQRFVLFFALYLGLVIPSQAEPRVVVKGDAFDRATVDRIMGAFWLICSPLTRYKSDIVQVRVETHGDPGEIYIALGWLKRFDIAVEMADDPKVMPGYDDEAGVMAGHTLHYSIGGGTRPGMFAYKNVSQKLCGIELTETGRSFKDVPAFSAIRY